MARPNAGFTLDGRVVRGRDAMKGRAGRFHADAPPAELEGPKLDEPPVAPPPLRGLFEAECARTQCVRECATLIRNVMLDVCRRDVSVAGIIPAIIFESLACPAAPPSYVWRGDVGCRVTLSDGSPATLTCIEPLTVLASGDERVVTGGVTVHRAPRDPILPDMAGLVFSGGPTALRKRCRTIIHDARVVSAELLEASVMSTVERICDALHSCIRTAQKEVSVATESDELRLGSVSCDRSPNCVTLRYGSWVHEILPAHYDKLQRLFCGAPAELNLRLVVMLQRYFNVGGAIDSVAEGGWHGAVPPRVMRSLKDTFGVNSEAFASPLNATFTRYCSAFADTDSVFGSCGSFFDTVPVGVMEANPPFDHAVAVRMAQRMNDTLRGNTSAGFVVILPYSDRGVPLPSVSAVVEELRGGGFVAAETSVSWQDCDFVDGSQHVAQNTSFLARLDTRIFVLQGVAHAAEAAARLEKVVSVWRGAGSTSSKRELSP